VLIVSARPRLVAFAFTALLAALVLVQGVAPELAAAKSTRVTKKDACKVVTKAQLERDLGGTATVQPSGIANKGLDVGCSWAIGASGDRPAGTIRMVVSFAVPAGAYAALKDNPQYQVIDTLGAKSLYVKGSGTLYVFKSGRILKMTGLFNDATVRPIRIYDPQLPLEITAKDALPRL
jgi:hypothetical protein